jgi:signal transduction histidine kinase
MSGASLTEGVARRRQGPAGRLWQPVLDADLLGRYGLGVALLTALYYGAAHLGYAFEFSGPVAAIVWLPVGVGISFLYLGGLRFWPGVVIGDLLVNNYSTIPLGSALGQSVGNLLEVVIASVLLRRVARRGPPLASVHGLSGTLLALGAGTLLSASVGALTLSLGEVVSTSAIPHVWRTWLLGDFAGALVVVSLVLAWSPPPQRPWLRGRRLEAGLLLVILVALSELALHNGRPLSYVVFPALIWAALRFGPRGATTAIAICAGFVLWGASHYLGPFVVESIGRTVLNTQLFIVVSALTALSVAALVSERELFARRIGASSARLVEAADNERRRLERNLHDGAQQRLVALAAHLGLAAERAQEAPEEAAGLFEASQSELLLAIEELRELAHGIHPPVLREFGLASAVEAVAARAPVAIELGDMPRVRLDETAEATAYYLIVEALANAEKYARASRVRVRAKLRYWTLEVEVSDDGVGGAVERPGLGLEGMRDRVEATGGSFRLDSERGRGTTVWASVPATVVERVR